LQLFSSPPPPVYWSQILLTAMTITLWAASMFPWAVHLGADEKTRYRGVLSFALVLPPSVSLCADPAHQRGPAGMGLLHFDAGTSAERRARSFRFPAVVFYVTITAFILMRQDILEGRRLKG